MSKQKQEIPRRLYLLLVSIRVTEYLPEEVKVAGEMAVVFLAVPAPGPGPWSLHLQPQDYGAQRQHCWGCWPSAQLQVQCVALPPEHERKRAQHWMS